MSNITITPEDWEAADNYLRSDTSFVETLARHRLSGHKQGVAEERARAAGIAERMYVKDAFRFALGVDIAHAIRTPNKGEAA